jgi:hypothetical protein
MHTFVADRFAASVDRLQRNSCKGPAGNPQQEVPERAAGLAQKKLTNYREAIDAAPLSTRNPGI